MITMTNDNNTKPKKSQKVDLHIWTKTQAGQMLGPRSSSVGPSLFCRRGWPILSGIPDWAPEPGSLAASAGHRPSGEAALWVRSHRRNEKRGFAIVLQ